MSRCKICDVKLTDDELTNKDLDQGEYLDTCFQCLGNLAGDVEELLPIDYLGGDYD